MDKSTLDIVNELTVAVATLNTNIETVIVAGEIITCIEGTYLNRSISEGVMEEDYKGLVYAIEGIAILLGSAITGISQNTDAVALGLYYLKKKIGNERAAQ